MWSFNGAEKPPAGGVCRADGRRERHGVAPDLHMGNAGAAASEAAGLAKRPVAWGRLAAPPFLRCTKVTTAKAAGRL